ncbi:hypothetical protein L0P88_21935 [Muricauda sp. SCSIO 64092]|uniref:SMODS domain-containing nucleotidyltransferase n=1 Tax=Allomuricauda sp. SCSIO 64092 TaxID=2908842 RepID=UPI001FF6116A|nr:hypothetical protein [Muricauda sp. SCSIO 64092]UOY06570.1 hypothetical protein L0P88_21935 [Muricauda sp. SCSIO 64092]
MEKQFYTFCSNIKLTGRQREDAKQKYRGVSKKLHDHYYDSEFDGGTKFLFGSYKTKVNVRPLSKDQDVDLLFKIPKETFEKFDGYESNGQSALLQEVKDILKEKYTTTEEIKGWGKVVLVAFSDNTHNVEVLPAYEQEDGTFLIPNTENGGSWESFDPRKQINNFQSSNSDTDGLTGELCRMIKTWVKNTSSLSYKSFELVVDVIDFLESEFEDGADYDEYQEVVKNFFDFLKGKCSSDTKSHVETAFNRAVKAIEFFDNDKPKEASEEWRKVFGNEFPKVNENPVKERAYQARTIVTPSAPWHKL